MTIETIPNTTCCCSSDNHDNCSNNNNNNKNKKTMKPFLTIQRYNHNNNNHSNENHDTEYDEQIIMNENEFRMKNSYNNSSMIRTIYFEENWIDYGLGGGLWSTGLALAKYFVTPLQQEQEQIQQQIPEQEVQQEQHTIVDKTIHDDPMKLYTNHALNCIRTLVHTKKQQQQQQQQNHKKNVHDDDLSLSNSNSNNCLLNVLELGSGNGLVSVCLAVLAYPYIQKLVITDTIEHLPMIYRTVQMNHDYVQLQMNPISIESTTSLSSSTTTTNETTTTTESHPSDDDDDDYQECTKSSSCCNQRNDKVNTYILEHKWGEFTSTTTTTTNTATINTSTSTTVTTTSDLTKSSSSQQQQEEELFFINQIQSGTIQFDLILGSDLAYREELYEPLIQSFLQYSHSNTIILLGVTMLDTTPTFFQLLTNANFIYKKLADPYLTSEYRGTTFGIFIIQKQKS